MDIEFDVIQTQRHNVQVIISEISSIFNHANISFENINSVHRLHKESGCTKDCFDNLPAPHNYVRLIVELNSILQELGNQLAAQNKGSAYIRNLLQRAYFKIEEAQLLFSRTLLVIKDFCNQPRKCRSKKTIYRYLNKIN